MLVLVDGLSLEYNQSVLSNTTCLRSTLLEEEECVAVAYHYHLVREGLQEEEEKIVS